MESEGLPHKPDEVSCDTLQRGDVTVVDSNTEIVCNVLQPCIRT